MRLVRRCGSWRPHKSSDPPPLRHRFPLTFPCYSSLIFFFLCPVSRNAMHRATAWPRQLSLPPSFSSPSSLFLSPSFSFCLSFSLEHALLRNNEGIYFINTGYPPARHCAVQRGRKMRENLVCAGRGKRERESQKGDAEELWPPWLTCHFTDCLLVFHERFW